MRGSFALLHPGAMAIAGGAGALVLALLGGFGMMGAGAMMGGGWMMGNSGVGGYAGYHMSFASGIVALLCAAIAGAIAGWVLALVYNSVVLSQPVDAGSTSTNIASR